MIRACVTFVALAALAACSPQLPEISYLQVGPAPVYAKNAISIQLALDHPEFEVVEELLVELYINDVRQDPPLPFKHVPVGEHLNLPIPKNKLKKDRLLEVRAQAFDGTNYSRIETSEPVYVFNTPPQDGTVRLLPLQPRAGLDPIVCTSLYGFSDPDEADTLTWQIDWYLNDSLWIDDTKKTTYRGDTIEAKYLRAGQQWQCGLTLSDGEEYTLSTSEKITVAPNPWIVPPDNGGLIPDTGSPDVPTDTGDTSGGEHTADTGVLPTDTSLLPTGDSGGLPTDTSLLPTGDSGSMGPIEDTDESPVGTDAPVDTGILP